MSSSKYITIEGGDNSGKTYFIENRLKKLFNQHIVIQEPNNYRDDIKKLLNDITPIIESDLERLDNLTQITHIMHATLSLLMANRYMQHDFITKNINLGITVISDRCILSSYIYQLRLLYQLIKNRQQLIFYKEPKIVTILLDYMFDQIFEFSSNPSLMPNKILILSSTFKKDSNENIDNSSKLQEIIRNLYLNIHSDGMCPISLRKNSYIIDSDTKDEKLIEIINT